MDKEQAEKALGIIREVIDNTREDLVAHNWGLIWMIHAFTNGAAFASIGWFVERQGLPMFWYLVPLAVVAAVNLAIVLLLTDRDRGVRSFIEQQLHGIWLTFILFTLAGAAVLHISGSPPKLFCPFLAITSGIGFAMMGVVFNRNFFAFALLFLLVAVVSAVPGAVPVQWYLVAAAWWAAMFVPGIMMFRQRKQRLSDEGSGTIL